MKIIFLPLKIKPEDVLPLLKIIKENNNRKKIEQETLKYYKQSSKHIDTPHLNPFRTRVPHSLRKLLLIKGEKNEYGLTTEGEYLYNFSDDFNRYRKELAKMILHIDIDKCKITEIFQQNKKTLSYNEIVDILRNNNIIISKSDDKLRRWLQFLTYCGILSYEPPLYTLNMSMLESLQVPEQNIPLKEFKKILYQEYKKLKKGKGPYVSIPLLKSAVSEKLKQKGFSLFDFKSFLIKTIKEKSSKKINLHETGVREGGGIMDDKVYYHFISIREK